MLKGGGRRRPKATQRAQDSAVQDHAFSDDDSISHDSSDSDGSVEERAPRPAKRPRKASTAAAADRCSGPVVHFTVNQTLHFHSLSASGSVAIGMNGGSAVAGDPARARDAASAGGSRSAEQVAQAASESSAPTPQQTSQPATTPRQGPSDTSRGSALTADSRNVVSKADVGRRIKVYWPAEQKWFAGVVKSFSAKHGCTTITYDDGEVRVHDDLRENGAEFEFLTAQARKAVPTVSATAADTSAPVMPSSTAPQDRPSLAIASRSTPLNLLR